MTAITPNVPLVIDDPARQRAWEIIKTLLAWAVGIYFIYAAYSKVFDPASFATDIKRYKMMPLWIINSMALLMPWLEIAAGAALLFSNWRRAGASLVLMLLVVFVIALLSALNRGLDISCGCTGKGSGKAGVLTVVRNLSMIAAMCIVLWYRPKPPKQISA